MSQITAEHQEIKDAIVELKEQVDDAKQRQKVAEAECKKLEKDMTEFKSNKDGKIGELKVKYPWYGG